MASSIELSTTSYTRWCRPRTSRVADVHARPLADVLQIAHVAHLLGAVIGRLPFRGLEFALCIQIPLGRVFGLGGVNRRRKFRGLRIGIWISGHGTPL